MRRFYPLVIVLLLVFGVATAYAGEFPIEQPKNGNFNRPLDGQILDVSPPGFCWWRSSPRGDVQYRLSILNASGETVVRSDLLSDPVYVPDEVLPAGDYSWIVEAMDPDGNVDATRPAQSFSIAENAFELPWVEPELLLEDVPKEHPRLLFPSSKLQEIQASLSASREEPYQDLRATADEALTFGLMSKPDFDKYDRKTEYEMRRTAYRASYHEFTRVYNRGMVPMALMYQLSGEEKYGLAAKKHLLHLLDWELDGIASLESSFDEIGLRIARTSAQGYDWLYDLFTEEEREAVKQMLIAHGDQMLARLELSLIHI